MIYIWHSARVHAIQSGKIIVSETPPEAGQHAGLNGTGPMGAETASRGNGGWRLHKTVVLVGMMGAGKTAVGTALARLLDVPFMDCDDEIVKAANRSIAEIFDRDGEAFFRRKESQVLRRLLEGAPVVLSTGGGAFLAEENRHAIAEMGISVWLRADLDLLWQRVRHKTTRPLLRTPNPRETLRQIFEARLPVYALADVGVESRAEYSIEEMAAKVLGSLAFRPDVVMQGDRV